MGFEQDFGVFMKIAPPFGDFRQQFRKAVLDGHLVSPVSVYFAGIRRSTSSAKKLHPAGIASSSKT
jgi:hypothetical protein